jgi:HSP20 family protein
MAMVRWAPRTEIEAFTPFAGDPFFRRFYDLLSDDEAAPRAWHPALDLIEEKDRLVVRLELPGVDAKDVHVSLQGEVLIVEGERRHEPLDEQNGRYLKREQSAGAFQRTLQLPYRVRGDQVKALVRNGIMTIVLPKADEHVGRQIPVQVEK